MSKDRVNLHRSPWRHPSTVGVAPWFHVACGAQKNVIRDCCFVNPMNTLANLDVTSVKHHSEIGVIFTNAIGGLTLIHIVHVYPYKSVRFSQPDGAKLEIMLVFPQKQNINQSTITGWWFGT